MRRQNTKTPHSLKLEVGEKIVFCPENEMAPSRLRGAAGEVVSLHQKGGSKRKRVRSILVKWFHHRKTTTTVIVRGGNRRRRERQTSGVYDFSANKVPYTRRLDFLYEFGALQFHPASYCDDCPLRMHRLLASCPGHITKKQHKEKRSG